MNVAINGGNPLEVEWQDFIVANDIRRLSTVKKLSELLLERQSRLLGHVMRREENDPDQSVRASRGARMNFHPWAQGAPARGCVVRFLRYMSHFKFPSPPKGQTFDGLG